ncbi:MAG TPA: methyltransferase [Chloroflexi bacterium]|nr:methyltransferase [Chloroflexota bacterium]
MVEHGSGSGRELTRLAGEVLRLAGVEIENPKTALPSLAKSGPLALALVEAVRRVPTAHTMYLGDARQLDMIPDESVHLIVTSPPYWTLKTYEDSEGQLGHVEGYDEFLDELDRVWHHCLRVLVKGGRLIIVVGDVCLSRRHFGRHVVMPLHASFQERCRLLGFDNLAPIIWYKIANAALEVQNGSSFLGKPYEPNAIIKNDIEYILMQRKAGGYRKPSLAQRVLSVIPEHEHRLWFQQIWQLPGASTRDHPAPFPMELAERLIRMFSFVGDTVLDPFMGTGTTNLVASLWGRNSIGVEIQPTYFDLAVTRVQAEHRSFFSTATIAVNRDARTVEKDEGVVAEPFNYGTSQR